MGKVAERFACSFLFCKLGDETLKSYGYEKQLSAFSLSDIGCFRLLSSKSVSRF